MDGILKFISKETNGECYTSYKYCYDVNAIPSIAYDEKPNDKIHLKEYGEENHSSLMRNIKPLAEKLKTQPPLFRYFLDGSRRTYKVDDIEYNNRKVYPIVAGQIRVACCERIDRSHFRKASIENHIILSLPDIANADGHNPALYFNSLTNKINTIPHIAKRGIALSKIIPYSSQVESDSYENKGIAKIQDEMVECEKKIVAQLTAKNLLSQDAYLIKDGTLQYKPMKSGDYREISKILNNYRWVVGVSKSFNPELMKDKNDKSNAATIAHLELYHRTPAFLYAPGESFGGVKFAVWYVRIREPRYTDTQFSGILKIEKILITEQECNHGLTTEEVDYITANIINERNPVCYGNDFRWANHLYPIYLTERFCKSQYISDPYFLNLF